MNINESPITHDMQDLNDFSIHEPSIRPGKSVSVEFEKWATSHCWMDNSRIKVVAVGDLREFIKGKVLVDANALKIIMNQAAISPLQINYGTYSNAMAALVAALHPTSSGDQP